jgi:hypothetical protein
VGYCGAASRTTHPEMAPACPAAPSSRLVALALEARSCSSSLTPKRKKQTGQWQEADLRKQEAGVAGVGYCGAASRTTHPEIAASCPAAPASRLLALVVAAASSFSSLTPKRKKQTGQAQEADLRKQISGSKKQGRWVRATVAPPAARRT